MIQTHRMSHEIPMSMSVLSLLILASGRADSVMAEDECSGMMVHPIKESGYSDKPMAKESSLIA